MRGCAAPQELADPAGAAARVPAPRPATVARNRGRTGSLSFARILIVGGSAAGSFAAEGLRRHGFTGEIVIVGDEPAYDRPPLSKQFLAGDWDRPRIALVPPERDAAIAALRRQGRGEALDLSRRTVRLSDGADLEWDQLVIATGVRPRRLAGGEAKGVHHLRSDRDALALAADIRRHGRLTIIGGGFIGLEVAATARKLGASVMVLEPQADPMIGRLGPEVAAKLLARHRAEGVDLRLGCAVRALETGAAGRTLERVQLADGGALETPALLVAIGCTPNVEWLQGSGLALDNGVVCDAFCRAAEGVWAAGDVARWQHLGLGRSLRIEHRTNAAEQAEAVARNILGAGIAYTPVPFFWTDQYDVKIQLAGVCPPEAERRIEFGELEGRSFVQTWRVGGRLVGVIAWNAAKALTGFRRELTFDQPVVAAGGSQR